MDERFETLVNALNNITAKRKNIDETELGSSKRARTSVESPDPQLENEDNDMVGFDYSSDSRPYGESGDEEQDVQEEIIIPDQVNLAEDIEEICDTAQNNLLDGISKKFSVKQEVCKPVDDKLASIVNSLFLSNMEEEKIKELSKKYHIPENCPSVTAPRVNKEIWKGNLLSTHKHTDIRLRSIEKLNVMAAYSCIASCQIINGRMGKFKEDLTEEILSPLIDSLAFLGQSVNDMNQFRRDQIKPRLPAKMKELTNNVPPGSKLLFGDDLNKRISQINNTNTALSLPSSSLRTPSNTQHGRYGGNNGN